MCPARRYCNVDRGTHFANANARTDLYPSDLYSKIASCIIVSVYASISRKVAIVVGLHVDVQEQLQIPGQVPHELRNLQIHRAICSRCRALRTECSYNAEEGESPWSALRQRIRMLERKRDEARDLLSQIQSKPEIGAYEIYRCVRSRTPTGDMSALI